MKVRHEMKVSFLSIFALLLIGCATQPGFNRNAFLERSERKLSTYQATFEPNIENRVHLAPPEIIQYLNQMDSTDKYLPYSPTRDELKIVAQYFALLPSKYLETIQHYVVGVYFISNFIGGGMSDFLYDEKGSMYIALYLNPELLQKSVEEWIEYRENASFLEDSSIAIKVESDQSYRGLLHTLVHESSHIYDYYYHATPYIEPFFKNEKGSGPTRFTQAVWEDYQIPKAKYDFLRKSHYSGYGLDGKIDSSKAVMLYSSLSSSPFSSLYGSLSWAEDFAESFTWYYLKERLGVSYKVTVQKNGKVVAEFEPSKDSLILARYPVFADILK
jgi:hypothetical protein